MSVMSKVYPKLTDRNHCKALKPSESIWERGIKFTRMPNGDGRWSINIMVDGRRISRVVGPESEGVNLQKVARFIDDVRAKAREDRLNLTPRRKLAVKFKEAAADYIKRLTAEGGKDVEAKRRRLEQHLTPFFGQMVLTAIDATHVESYKKVRLGEVALRGGSKANPKDPAKRTTTKPATINRELAALSHLLHRAVDWQWVPQLPVKVKMLAGEGHRQTYLSVDECNELLRQAKSDDSPAIYPFILIGLRTSMRMGEILRIRRGDVDVAARTIFIPKAKSGARRQPMSGDLAEYLKAYIEAMPDHQQWLFPSATSKDGHLTTVRKTYRRVVIAAALDPDVVVRHTLRHTAISHIVQAGVDLMTVKTFSGHKTLAMVERYSHATEAHVRSAVDRLEARYAASKAA